MCDQMASFVIKPRLSVSRMRMICNIVFWGSGAVTDKLKLFLRSSTSLGLFGAGLAWGLAGAGTAFANDLYPKFSLEVPVEIQSDTTFDSDDEDAEITDTFATIEPTAVFSFNELFSVQLGLIFEPVDGGADPEPGDDIFFENHGLYVDTLFAQVANERLFALAGKYAPTFGIAWDISPGVFGTDFAEDYEFAEQIGVAAGVTFGGEAVGDHTLTLNSFFADTSGLSGSVFEDRPQLDEDDGGPANTEDLCSFSATLIGESVPFLGGLGYALSAQSLENETSGGEDQTGFAIALFGGFDLTESLSVEPVVEYATLDGFGGDDVDAEYITAGLAFLMGSWNLSLAYTDRTLDEAGGSEFDDTLLAVSAGYEFANGLTFDLGLKQEDAEDVESSVFGALLTYTLGYEAP